MDETKLRWVYALVSDYFKNHPCETCNGTGWHVRQSVPEHVELDGHLITARLRATASEMG